MKFYIKDFFSKSDQILSFLQIWSHLLEKSLMEHFIFCAVKRNLEMELSIGMLTYKFMFFHGWRIFIDTLVCMRWNCQNNFWYGIVESNSKKNIMGVEFEFTHSTILP